MTGREERPTLGGGQDQKDYELLINSPYLFARKFNENVNFEIVQKIYNNITVEFNHE